jgi:hypothetical protein
MRIKQLTLISVVFMTSLSLTFTSCEPSTKSKLSGLWTITRVEVGDQEMTPNARWVRFYDDGTQESGNGWQQHSIGTWQYDAKLLLLKIENTNGLKDPFDAFQVDLKGDKMSWYRAEEGQETNIFLERIDRIPASEGDQLMGFWTSDSAVLFIRWDKRYVWSMDTLRNAGIYHVHGHRNEIQFIEEGKPRSFYSFSIENDQLELKPDSGDVLTFTRSRELGQ